MTKTKLTDKQIKNIAIDVFLLPGLFIAGYFWNMRGPIAFVHETGHVIFGWLSGVKTFWGGPRYTDIWGKYSESRLFLCGIGGFVSEGLVFGGLTLLFAGRLRDNRFSAWWFGHWHATLVYVWLRSGFWYEGLRHWQTITTVYIAVSLVLGAGIWLFYIAFVLRNHIEGYPSKAVGWIVKTWKKNALTKKYKMKYN